MFKECCKQCRYVMFKGTMTKWPVQKLTQGATQKLLQHHDATNIQKTYIFVFFGFLSRSQEQSHNPNQCIYILYLWVEILTHLCFQCLVKMSKEGRNPQSDSVLMAILQTRSSSFPLMFQTGYQLFTHAGHYSWQGSSLR